jgi:DNA-binding response OmpR family regulator
MVKILVAEHDPHLRWLVCRNLGQCLEPSPQLLEAADGKEAIRLAWKERPDLIVLDTNLPRLSGQQVCLELRKDSETVNLKLLLLRSSDPKRHEPRFEDDYLVKPFTAPELMQRVEQLLR